VHLRTAGAVVSIISGSILVAALLVGIGASFLRAAGVPPMDPAPRALLDALQFVGFGVAIVAFLSVADDWDLVRWRVPTLRDVGWIVGGLLVLLVALSVLSQLVTAFGISAAESSIIKYGKRHPAYLLYLVPVTFFLVGPTEELIFRGIVQGSLRRAYGPTAAVVAASSLFALVHWTAVQGEGRVVTLVIILVLGGLLGVIYEITDNIVVTAAIHSLYNTVQYARAYLDVIGLF
jgi:membrane protease YdiL (CAAX protease family)